MTQRIYTWFGNKKFFDTLPKRVSSAALILENAAGEALVVKANYKEHWTFPGGIVDPGETPLQAALRETSEEVGLTIDPTSVAFVAVLDRISEHAQSYQFIFSAPLLAGAETAIVLQKSEIDSYAFVSKAKVVAADRFYAESVEDWAAGRAGYIEQVIDIRRSASAPSKV